MAYIFTFIEGILTFISPCILPMLPIYFLYLAGEHNDDNSKSSILILNSIGFVMGFTLVFVSLGAIATSLGSFLAGHREVLQNISGIIIILFGLNFMGIFKIKILNFEKKINFNFNRLNVLSSVLFGIVFGLGWTPCLGAFLGSALALASNSNTIWEGILLLLIYSLGLGLPFIIFSAIFSKVKEIFMQIQKHSRAISIISGILLILAGISVML